MSDGRSTFGSRNKRRRARTPGVELRHASDHGHANVCAPDPTPPRRRPRDDAHAHPADAAAIDPRPDRRRSLAGRPRSPRSPTSRSAASRCCASPNCAALPPCTSAGGRAGTGGRPRLHHGAHGRRRRAGARGIRRATAAGASTGSRSTPTSRSSTRSGPRRGSSVAPRWRGRRRRHSPPARADAPRPRPIALPADLCAGDLLALPYAAVTDDAGVARKRGRDARAAARPALQAAPEGRRRDGGRARAPSRAAYRSAGTTSAAKSSSPERS